MELKVDIGDGNVMSFSKFKEIVGNLIEEYTFELVLEIKKATLRDMGSWLCSNGGKFTLDYTVTIPNLLILHAVRRENPEKSAANFDEWNW